MSTNQAQNEVVPEQPGVVVGGPLDSSSPEGMPPEGLEIGNGNAPNPAGDTVESFYKSPLKGEIKTAQEAKDYIKTLEDIAIQSAASNLAKAGNAQPAPQFVPMAPIPAPAQQAKERFKEVIYSNPDEAFELAVGEAQNRINMSLAAERNKEMFWKEFYDKNPDLRGKERAVQSIMNERSHEISLLKTRNEVAEYVSKESRDFVGSLTKGIGYKETQLPSEKAVAFGGSRESVPTPPAKPAEPKSFVQQLLNNRPKKK